LTIRAHGVDEHVELTVPAFPDFVEHALDGCGIPGIGDQSHRIGTAAVGEIAGRLVENILGAADKGHPRTVVGQALRGGETHAATAADDDGGGVLQPEVHDAPLRARPLGLALLGERDRALLGVVGGGGRDDKHAPVALRENFVRHAWPFTFRPIC
jgi:hypothetical protein